MVNGNGAFDIMIHGGQYLKDKLLDDFFYIFKFIYIDTNNWGLKLPGPY